MSTTPSDKDAMSADPEKKTWQEPADAEPDAEPDAGSETDESSGGTASPDKKTWQ